MKPKSQSLKMRAIFWRLWEQNHKGFETAEDFYQDRMTRLNDMLIKKLDDVPMPEE